jgi:hypothetical protein
MSMSKKSAPDHAIALTKAAVQLIPGLGGLIASLIDDYVPTSAQHALEKTLLLLNEKVTFLEARIDLKAVNKEEFSELFESCRTLASRNRREEKLHAAANLMANLLLRPGDPGKVPYEELDHLVRCVNQLSIGAIAVLGALRRLGAQAHGNLNFRLLKDSFSTFEASFLMSLVSELSGINLIVVQHAPIRLPDFSHVRLWLTPIGQRLVERFIEGKM